MDGKSDGLLVGEDTYVRRGTMRNLIKGSW